MLYEINSPKNVAEKFVGSEQERVMEYDDVFDPSTNWRVAGGALSDSISFESEDRISPAAVDHVAMSPLFLLPPSPDGEPCEISITFAQEHELRQIYIRSSARVYEVYYTKKRRHDKEYLCTVRCGIAMRQEQVPPSSKNLMGDDWIDVKAVDASLLNHECFRKQELFEATAEISDAEPCISITLRLLSLQDKTYALVDEVYVFADPSEPDQDKATGTTNSSTSSLMAMFMPTLLQLSDVRKERDRQVSLKSNNTNPATLGNSNDSGKIQQEKSFSKDDHKGLTSPILVDTPPKHVDATLVPGAELKCGSSVETILHQLANKVSQIETILTRFEDQMLKPIHSIDARLQLVEEKLQLLDNKSFASHLFVETRKPCPNSLSTDNELDPLTKTMSTPQLAACTKALAPDSSTEDYAVLLPNNMMENVSTKIVQLGSEKNSISGDEIISTQSEISNGEVDHSFVSAALEETPKPSLSINEALASALAGLLSSTSVTDENYSQTLIATAPEFSNEGDMETTKKPPTGSHPEKCQSGAEELGNTISASESLISLQKELGVALCIEDGSKEMINGLFEKFGDSVEEYDDSETVLTAKSGGVDEDTVTSRNEADSSTKGENLIYEPRNLIDLENPNVISGCGSRRLINEGEPGMDNVLKSLLGFQPTNCSVDFLTPVLDVKFNSKEEVSENECLFEAVHRVEAKTVVDGNTEVLDENLVSAEDEELKGQPTGTLSSVELDDYKANEMHLQLNADVSTASLVINKN